MITERQEDEFDLFDALGRLMVEAAGRRGINSVRYSPLAVIFCLYE